MPFVKVLRSDQTTLPARVRDALHVKEGDYLEAELVEGGVLLKPVDVAACGGEGGWARVRAALDRVRYAGPEPAPSEEKVTILSL